MHWVFHATLPAKIVNTDDLYYEHLKTGEWFDRPQSTNQRGNSHDAEQIQSERTERRESKHQLIGLRLSETESSDLQSNQQGNSPETSGRFPVDSKRRGRPPKKG